MSSRESLVLSRSASTTRGLVASPRRARARHVARYARRDVGAVVRIGVPSPSTAWLQKQRQLTALGRLARETYERLANGFPWAPR